MTINCCLSCCQSLFLLFDKLEVEVALAAGDVVDVLGGDFPNALIGYFGQLLLDEGVALCNGVLAGKVHEVLLERHQCIRCADVTNLAGLAQFHEAVASAARTVACRAETGKITDRQQPVDDFIKGARVAHVELSRLVMTLDSRVATNAGTAAAADL